MKTEEILSIEESAENRINLVRDRLFWQAWNRSAFLFVTHIKKYQDHKRFVQKVSQEVADTVRFFSTPAGCHHVW